MCLLPRLSIKNHKIHILLCKVMTESEKILAFERKLKQLKEEEAVILKLLKDVQKQLRKYEVEELQTCSESIIDNSDEESSDSDENVGKDHDLLLKVLDCAELVNDTSLDLGLKKILGGESYDEESEESEESD